MTQPTNELLLQKLDAFIRKYYVNQFIRGLIYVCILLLVLFLSVIVSEYYGHYAKVVRKGIFFSFITLSALCISWYIIRPILAIYRIGKIITYEQAADIIGRHFSSVQDALLNALQLRNASLQKESDLLLAAIEQKTLQMNPLPFEQAIDYSKNKKYIKYLIILLFTFGMIQWISPGMIRENSLHIFKYDSIFPQKAPFEFKLLNKSLQVEPFSDVEIIMEINGKKLPDQSYLCLNDQRIRMLKSNQTYTYTLKNIHEPSAFHFEAAGFSSSEFLIDLYRKPQIIQYTVTLQFPSYLGLSSEQKTNPGNLQLPIGTKLKWNVFAKNSDSVEFGFPPRKYSSMLTHEDHFNFEKTMMQNSNYYIKAFNREGIIPDSISFAVEIIPDAFPQIEVQDVVDSLDEFLHYFAGEISDDHGVTRMRLAYRILKSSIPEKITTNYKYLEIPLSSKQIPQRFYFTKNLKELNIQAGEEVEFYFEVFDNDAVNGPKSSRSENFRKRQATLNETRTEIEQSNDKLKKEMSETLKELKELNKDLKQYRQKLPEKKELSWEDKRNAEKLLERQKELTQKLEALQNKFQNNKEKENLNLENQKEIIEKQEMLQKMYEELMSPEWKELMQKMEQNLKMQNKDLLKNELDKMQLSNKDVEKELDRMLQTFKELEVEKKADDVAQRLEKLAEKQDQLAKETQDKTKSKEQLANEQQQIKDELKDIKKTYDDATKENEQLEDKKDLPDLNNDENETGNKMDESKQELDKGRQNKSAEKQKEAADKMKEMSKKIKEKMEAQEEKEMEIDMRSLREILDDLVRLSKDQEKLMLSFNELTAYNPTYVELAQQQKFLRDHAAILEDSLFALSKRASQISSFINKEAGKLRDRLNKSIQDFSERNFPMIRNDQQYAMSHANNLALMLSEVMQQMQQEQQQQKSGKGKSSKRQKMKMSGKGKPSLSEMKKMQEELNKQLKEGLNKQNQSGQKNPQGMSSQEFARMAAQQMAIRQKVQQMMKEMGNEGKNGNGNQLRNELGQMKQMMEQTEKELFNKQLSNDILRRQQDIVSRMLESEKAEKEQDQDNKREAEKSKEVKRKPPQALEPYIRKKQIETELLKQVSPDLKPYYKEKVQQYLHKVPQ